MPEASHGSPPSPSPSPYNGDNGDSDNDSGVVALGSRRVFFRKTTLVDYPGRVAAALFLPGCSLRCPWCQNRELVTAFEDAPFTKLEEALAHIKMRRAVLGGVVISGGEPTNHPALGPLITCLHRLNLPVKLDTNGMHPLSLAKLFENAETRPDYIALDLKLAPERYAALLSPAITGGDPGALLRESARCIAESGIDREYRSLALPDDQFSIRDVEALAPLITGDFPWYFRCFVPGNCLDPAWNSRERPTPDAAETLAEKARELGKKGAAPVL
jgi:pyruvate formate lyase activating enzyme